LGRGDLAPVEAGLVLVLVLPCAALVLGAVGLTATAPPTPTLDAGNILQRSESRWQGLSSYQVPVTISGSVRVAFVSVPFKMAGTQYYQAPDEQALHLDNPPSYARGLGNTLSTIGTPQTWLRDYAIAQPVTQPHGHHTAYVLTGSPKRESRIKTMTMWISATTYGIESIIFSYTNGASLTITFQRRHGATQYHLPRSATIVAKFPSYSGNAQIVYGDYRLNQPIPATVFAPH
jgi:outer membrane lipoprotein-sorting protein